MCGYECGGLLEVVAVGICDTVDEVCLAEGKSFSRSRIPVGGEYGHAVVTEEQTAVLWLRSEGRGSDVIV